MVRHVQGLGPRKASHNTLMLMVVVGRWQHRCVYGRAKRKYNRIKRYSAYVPIRADS